MVVQSASNALAGSNARGECTRPRGSSARKSKVAPIGVIHDDDERACLGATAKPPLPGGGPAPAAVSVPVRDTGRRDAVRPGSTSSRPVPGSPSAIASVVRDGRRLTRTCIRQHSYPPLSWTARACLPDRSLLFHRQHHREVEGRIAPSRSGRRKSNLLQVKVITSQTGPASLRGRLPGAAADREGSRSDPSRCRRSGHRFGGENLGRNKSLSGRSVGLPTQVCLGSGAL